VTHNTSNRDRSSARVQPRTRLPTSGSQGTVRAASDAGSTFPASSSTNDGKSVIIAAAL
jgi:hypothetical protein